MSSESLMAAIKARHSQYALKAESGLEEKDVIGLVNAVMLNVPSAFNMQSVRTIVLFGAAHRRFWQGALDTFLAHEADGATIERVKGRTEGLIKGAGTIAFLDDAPTVAQWESNAPKYAALFPAWAQHSQGMHQFALWTALSAEGVGCNLQHYQFDARIDAWWRKEFDILDQWQMHAQLVFGGREDTSEPPAKEKLGLDTTVRIERE